MMTSLNMNSINVHKLFYLNMLTLDLRYSLGTVLREMINEEMFAKVNIKGFHEVIYYLFNIIDSNYVAKNFIWPLLTEIDRRKFNSEVVKYINIIKQGYTDLIIPIKPSMIKAPGGVQISNFFWKLTVYILSVVVNKNSEDKVEYVNINSIYSGILPARIKIVFTLPSQIIVEQLKIDMENHRKYVGGALKETRKLEHILMQSEVHSKSLSQELNELVNDSQMNSNARFKFHTGRCEEGIEEWNSAVEQRLKEFSEDTAVICEFNNILGICYKLLEERKNQKKLDGQVLKKAFHYSSETFDLNEFFELSNTTTNQLLRDNFASIDFSGMLKFLPNLRIIVKDLSRCFSNLGNVEAAVNEIFNKTHVSLRSQMHNLVFEEDTLELCGPLQAVNVICQSPFLNLAERESKESGYDSIGSESRLGSVQRKDDNTPKWLAKSTDSINNSTSKFSSICQSLIKNPKKISWNGDCNNSEYELFSSVSKVNSTNFNSKSANKLRRISLIPRYEQNVSGPIKKRLSTCFEGGNLNGNKTGNNVVETNGNVTIKFSTKEKITPKKLNDLVCFMDKSPISLDMVSLDGHDLAPFSTSSQFQEEHCNGAFELGDIELPHDLSVCTLSPASSVDGTPVKFVDAKQNSEIQSPSGLLQIQGQNIANNNKRFTKRPSLDRLINRFYEIKNMNDNV